jgi:hypothetical protein
MWQHALCPLNVAECRDGCEHLEATGSKTSSRMRVSPNQRLNSSRTIRSISPCEDAFMALGRIVATSRSYSSVFSSKLIPTGSWRKRMASISSYRPAYLTLKSLPLFGRHRSIVATAFLAGA